MPDGQLGEDPLYISAFDGSSLPTAALTITAAIAGIADLAACPLSGRYRVKSAHRANRTQQARFIFAVATPLSADSLPRSGLVQVLIPDHETEVDFLNCEAISRTVVELLEGNRARALTVGIHGDWGAAKSSILKMVQRDLTKDKGVACL
jgi:KAP family P-loop domain